MPITTKDFATLVSDQVTAIQGAASKLVDTTIGSILRSVVEANAAVVLWLEGLVLTLLAITRAATSTSTDLDSWVFDYGLTRLPAAFAVGNVTFSRFTPTAQAVVLIGAVVQSSDGSQKYSVTLDAGNPAYNAGFGGYVLAPGTGSVTVPVAAQVAGALGNAAAGAVSSISQAISGVDTVTNALAFASGADAETDTALRLRFIAYINSLAKATKAAVQNAVKALGTGITAAVTEYVTYGGVPRAGYFFVIVDDGTGTPSAGTLTAATNAIDAVRPIGSAFDVYAPVVVIIPVSITVTVIAGYDATATKAAVQAAIAAFINSLPLAAPLQYTRLLQVAYDASPGVQNATSLLINGATSDITPTPLQVLKAGTVTVS